MCAGTRQHVPARGGVGPPALHPQAGDPQPGDGGGQVGLQVRQTLFPPRPVSVGSVYRGAAG